MNILIIEDEPKTARNLQEIIESIDKTHSVIGICDSIESSVEFILKHQNDIDLIFMDVHLADGYSFDIFNRINIESPVIFCTAYDEYALKAFALNGADYILKPFDKIVIENTFIKLINKLKILSSNINKNIGSSDNYKRDFLISSGSRDKEYAITDVDIVLIELKNENLLITTSKGVFYFFDYSIEQIESMLDPIHFFRINRQMIVNRKYIIEMHRTSNRQLQIFISIHTKVILLVSRRKVSDFIKWFN